MMVKLMVAVSACTQTMKSTQEQLITQIYDNIMNWEIRKELSAIENISEITSNTILTWAERWW